MSEKIVCGKCGESFDKLTIEYKSKCYSTANCGWSDSDVDEHLHMTCPVCGYTEAEACKDYQERKAEALEKRPQFRPATVPTYQPSLYGSTYGQRATTGGWDSNLD